MEPERADHSKGEVRVPASALYGPQTARAVANFPIGAHPMPVAIVHALGEIKAACALANGELGLLSPDLARAIREAALEVADGKRDGEFPLTVFQTGSGTSTNMNANEVVANLANERLGGGPRGTWRPAHPNDHVNLGQSSNDAFPTAIHIAAARATLPARSALEALARALEGKARDFDGVLKLGRTHLVDATPIRLGQELAGWASACARGAEHLALAQDALLEVPLGGTATGSGLNRHPELPSRALAALRARTGLALRAARNGFEANAFRDACAQASAAARTAAGSLAKISNDLRLLASGPQGGIGEVRLPELQPGSSIMPGKVNPVIPEAVRQIWARILGNDATCAVACALGELELNVLMPVMGEALLDSLALLERAATLLREKCVEGLEADLARCRALAERSAALATALAPRIGYERAAEIAKRAAREDRTILDVAREMKVLPEEELARLLDPRRLTEPGFPS